MIKNPTHTKKTTPNKTPTYARKVHRKELKGTETQGGFRGSALEAGEGKGGREEGKEEVQAQLADQASSQQCLCQEAALLKPWARGTALQEEGSPGAGTGKLKEEPSASKVSWQAGAGCRQRGREQGLGGGFLGSFACLSVVSTLLCRLPASSSASFALRSGAAPFWSWLQRAGTACCAQRSWTSFWAGDGVWLATQLSSGGRGLRHRGMRFGGGGGGG